jgi:predicted outer membrane repeat protein
MQRKSLLLGFTCALAVSGLASSAALASTCQVTNTTNSKATSSYETLQQAVSEAAPGNTLKVTGACKGDTTIAKNLTIVGRKATLEGTGSGSVLIIEPGAEVTITGPTITGGTGIERYGFAPAGGGIYNDEGSLTLEDSKVSGNSATYGGGIENLEGSLRLLKSTVSNNTSTDEGGGILNFIGSLTLEDSRVSGNAAQYGGGIDNFFGNLVLNERSAVDTNKATSGGGILIGVNEGANLTLENSHVDDNEALYGGGISLYREHGKNVLTLTSSTVDGNKAEDGGGLLLFEGGSVKLAGSTFVRGNTASEQGGGIYREASRDTIDEEPDWTGAITANKPNNVFTEPFTPEPEFTIYALFQRIEGVGSFTGFPLTGVVGQTVEYELIVENTGNVELEFKAPKDTKCGPISPSGPEKVAPESEEIYTCSHTLTSTGVYTDKASIEGNEGTGTQTSDAVKVKVS